MVDSRVSARSVGLVLLVDRPDRLGLASPGDEAAALDAAIAALRAIRPAAPLFVVHTATDAAPVRRAPRPRAGRPCHIVSAFHSDAGRLADLRAQRFPHLLVARRGIAALSIALVREALDQAARGGADLLRIDGVPDDVAYVTSARLLRDVLALGAVPGALTLPAAVDRLQHANPAAALPWTSVRAAHPTGGVDWRGASRTPLEEAEMSPSTSARDVLIALPSPYQTGAHFAWLALLEHLEPARVGFLVARGTHLARELARRGFATTLVGSGWLAAQGRDPHYWPRALDVLRPSVLHADGAECTSLLAGARQHGARIVVHVRLTVVERFLPACTSADTVVAVSSWLQRTLSSRLGTTPVVHIPDGVAVDARAAREPLGDRPVRLVCIGRVEPAKDQLRVLDIAVALAARRPCEIRFVGPCGNDVAYADEVAARLRACPPTLRASWMSFSHPVTPHYAWADVVLVASRNEALGMVGLEALAAGVLLVAQRSSGYVEIVDQEAGEGLLFDRAEPAASVAARIDAALATPDAYAGAARRKARTHFDARQCASRLSRIWSADEPSPG